MDVLYRVPCAPRLCVTDDERVVHAEPVGASFSQRGGIPAGSSREARVDRNQAAPAAEWFLEQRWVFTPNASSSL